MPNDEEIEWVRGPKKANLSRVSVSKIIEAHSKRGINVEASLGGNKSDITQTVVVGIPPKPDTQENR